MEPYLAALGVFAVTPLLFWSAWAVPFGLLAASPLVRAAAAGAVVTLMLGLATTLLIALLGAEPPLPTRVGAVLGGSVGLLLVFASARRDRRLRAAVLLCQRLGQPERRVPAARALLGLLDRAGLESAGNPEAHARLLLVVAGPMTSAGMWEEAAARLEGLPTGSLRPATRGLRAQALATACLQLGRLERAEAAIASAERPVEDADTERWLTTTEALLSVVQGGVERALSLLDAIADVDDAALLASGRVVRAHAHACRGQEGQARLELEQLLVEAGPLALERVLRPVGPATDLARALLFGVADEGSPQEGQSG